MYLLRTSVPFPNRLLYMAITEAGVIKDENVQRCMRMMDGLLGDCPDREVSIVAYRTMQFAVLIAPVSVLFVGKTENVVLAATGQDLTEQRGLETCGHATRT